MFWRIERWCSGGRHDRPIGLFKELFLIFDCQVLILTSGQSYKTFTLVNYDSRVVIWGIFKSGTTLES